jgi:hypothetical protein
VIRTKPAGCFGWIRLCSILKKYSVTVWKLISPKFSDSVVDELRADLLSRPLNAVKRGYAIFAPCGGGIPSLLERQRSSVGSGSVLLTGPFPTQ